MLLVIGDINRPIKEGETRLWPVTYTQRFEQDQSCSFGINCIDKDSKEITILLTHKEAKNFYEYLWPQFCGLGYE